MKCRLWILVSAGFILLAILVLVSLMPGGSGPRVSRSIPDSSLNKMPLPLPLALGLPALGILFGTMLISAGKSGNYDQMIYCWWIPGSPDDKRKGSRLMAIIVGTGFVIIGSLGLIGNLIQLITTK